MADFLYQEIKYLSGVGPKRADLLNKELNILQFKDLLYYFPYKYIDRTKFYKVSEIHSNLSHIQLKGKIINFQLVGAKYKKRFVATFSDGTGTVDLVWFKGISWIQDNLQINKEYIVFGKPVLFGRKINIPHPEIEDALKHESYINASLQPVYGMTEKLKNNYITSKTIQKLQNTILNSSVGRIIETLPEYLVKQQKLMSLEEALKNIHFPQDQGTLRKAQLRLKFEELFYIQLNLLKQKSFRANKFKGYVFSEVGDNFNSFYNNNLTFELTGAQKRVMKEIRKDLGSGIQMNRLLQGDVGSGKTLVALMSILIAVDNDYQACLMAPTEILANQHYETILKFLKELGLNVRLLTGSTKKAERRELHEQLKEGEVHVLIGTHALIEDTVIFKQLGLVVIDEQHRFGVAQRAKLWKKNVQSPHVLVMTATPIPRTLAMTLYGDLDVSVIDELPPGRKPIKTIHFFDSKRLPMFGIIRKQIDQGQQVYVVYPLIKESEKMDYKDLEDGLESMSREFPSPEYAISVVHGKMKAEEKDKSMQLFADGKTHIMVATTVIEVGVDVPNAAVMVIESAERFGLSQLHQLRGRVGRGAEQSYCILMTSYKLTSEAKKRIETMVSTTDGFEIAEVDMNIRGPGDMSGTQQSGIAFDLKIANIARDGQILQYARDVAMKIIEEDHTLEKDSNTILVQQLKNLSKTHVNWSRIS